MNASEVTRWSDGRPANNTRKHKTAKLTKSWLELIIRHNIMYDSEELYYQTEWVQFLK